MKSIKRKNIYKALEEISARIEVCGASPELTHAISLVTDLRCAIGNEFNTPDEYALNRVLDVISKSQPVTI